MTKFGSLICGISLGKHWRQIKFTIKKQNKIVFFDTIFGLLSKKRYLPHLEWKDYKVIFDKLSPTKKKLLKEKAIKSLENRFVKSLTTNKIDEIVSTKSAYRNDYDANKHVLNKNEKIKVLIATHNIQDVYNAYGENFFCDFYEWLHFLGKVSNSTNYDWYINEAQNLFSTWIFISATQTIAPHSTSAFVCCWPNKPAPPVTIATLSVKSYLVRFII